jgi:hypothetical protein
LNTFWRKPELEAGTGTVRTTTEAAMWVPGGNIYGQRNTTKYPRQWQDSQGNEILKSWGKSTCTGLVKMHPRKSESI